MGAPLVYRRGTHFHVVLRKNDLRKILRTSSDEYNLTNNIVLQECAWSVCRREEWATRPASDAPSPDTGTWEKVSIWWFYLYYLFIFARMFHSVFLGRKLLIICCPIRTSLGLNLAWRDSGECASKSCTSEGYRVEILIDCMCIRFNWLKLYFFFYCFIPGVHETLLPWQDIFN